MLNHWLTTGQAARLCAVDARTIARWLDAGALPCHRTVGGRRRMLRADLLTFMRQHGMPVPERSAPEQPRIAVVDDDPEVVRALLRSLQLLTPDADCRSAADGFQAGALLTSFRPHLVFLDIVMPGLSGVEVCLHLRATPALAQTAVAVVSGALSHELHGQLTAAGVERFISKPFSVHDIEAAVRELLPSRVGARAVGA